MRNRMRLAIAACVAVVLLVLAAGPAAAELGIRIEPNETVINRGSISIAYRDGMISGTITCNLGLALRYVSMVEKSAAGALPEGQIGIITGARTGECRQGMTNWQVIFLVTPMNPKPMRYNAFLGSLPEITGLLITALEVGVRIVSPNANCLFRGDLPYLISEVGGGQNFDQKVFLANSLAWVEGMTCPATATIEISGTLEIETQLEVALA